MDFLIETCRKFYPMRIPVYHLKYKSSNPYNGVSLNLYFIGALALTTRLSCSLYTARTARFSKKSLGSDVGEIKKISEKLKKMSVLTPRNVREKSNTVIYYKTPTLTIKRCEIKKWDINLYLYICMFLRLSFLII